MKRMLDIAVSLIGLICLLPLLLLVAVLIKLDSTGPIFFRQERIGRGFRPFQILKFRTMIQDPFGRRPLITVGDDPRITRAGRFLRKTKIDELPQLINVLRGDMCFVGPRPVTPVELMRYGAVRWHYVSVTPGITGLWQVSGRNRTTYDQRVALDKHYVETRNLWGDVDILARPVRVVLTGHGAA